MQQIDIPIPADLKKAFEFPPCVQVKLKTPSPLKVTLPTGGTLTAFSDLSKGIPSDCSLTFSLLLQIAPFLASTECLLKVLGLIGPLIEFVKAVPDPIKIASTVPKFLKAAEAVMPCIAVVTGLGIIPFIKDLLCLIIKALNCFLGQMKTLLGVMSGLSLQLSAAQANGDADLTAAIRCEQDNAQALAGNLTASIQPIGVVLQLAGTLFGIAGMKPIELPAIGSETDLESLITLVSTLQGVVGTLQIVADGLGGCDS
ncbi:MAG: hypothetical protein JO340_03635 [Acidobacteriaceae bacterium]|nr:hypothetical protein [Acidobacteriaceae bacterium]